MKKVLLSVMLIAMAVCVMAQDEAKKILFIGNSYTEVNDLPSLVQRVTESAGQRMTFGVNAPGGCTFQQHCTNQSMTLIQQGGWDVVVLQEQSQLPSFPDGQVQSECLPYAAQLAEAVYQYNPDGEAMFYMTWGRKYGDERNAQYFPVLGTYEGMDSMLYVRYMMMARDNDASVCPVGRVWRNLRNNYPDIELYQPDNSHPSMAGSYAAACAFYTMIFHRSPLEITFVPDIQESEASTIRNAVKEVVFDNLSFWLRQNGDMPDTNVSDTTTTDTTTTDTTHVGLNHVSGNMYCAVYPNPATSSITVELADFAGSASAVVYDIQGRRVADYQLTQPVNSLSISSYPVGVYTMIVTTSDGMVKKRIVKK